MYSFELDIDFNKLVEYFSGMNEAQINAIKSSGKVTLTFDILTKADVDDAQTKFLEVCKKHNLTDHYHEILYLLLTKKEDISLKHEVLAQNFETDKVTKQIASLILAYKQLGPNEELELHFKTYKNGVKVDSDLLSRWILGTILKIIEEQEFPPHTFGVKTLKDLFGDNPFDEDSLTTDRLIAASKLKPKRPEIFINRLYVELFIYLQEYLNNQTTLRLKAKGILSDAQAMFFFDILELFDQKTLDNVDSNPKDYIYVMFQNEVKRLKNKAILKSKI